MTNDQTSAAQGPLTLAEVAGHLLMIHDDLLDHDEEIGEEIGQALALEIIRREYVSGTCAAFAVALHDKYGYPIVGMAGGAHVAVKTPDGQIMDFMGVQPLATVLKRYGMAKATPVRVWTRAQALDHLLIDEEDETSPWNDVNLAKWVLANMPSERGAVETA